MRLNQLANDDKFNSLVEDIKGCFIEGYKTYEELKGRTMHSIGARMLEDNDFLNSYGKKIMPQLAKSTGMSTRVLYRCRKFAEQEPDFDKFFASCSSNWSWTKQSKLLDGTKPCNHEFEEKVVKVCKLCGKYE